MSEETGGSEESSGSEESEGEEPRPKRHKKRAGSKRLKKHLRSKQQGCMYSRQLRGVQAKLEAYVDKMPGSDRTERLRGVLRRAEARALRAKEFAQRHARVQWKHAQWEVDRVLSHCEGGHGRDPEHIKKSDNKPCKLRHKRVYKVSWKGEPDISWLYREDPP